MSNLSDFNRKLNRPLAQFVQVSDTTLQLLIAQLIEISSRGDIRVTEDGKYSIYDVISKVTEKGSQHEVWKRLTVATPKVLTICENLQFPGVGQRLTPVTDLAGIIEIIWLLPGEFSNKFRRLGAQVVSEVVTSQDNNQPTADLLNAINQLTNFVKEQSQTINDLKRNLSKVSENQNRVGEVVQDYMVVRKYADNVMPGYVELMDTILDSQGKLPPVEIEFTAPEWVDRHAKHLSQRQRICFYKEIASAHRFLVGVIPQKIKGQYIYSNKHEILFERAKYVAETMFPSESEPKYLLMPVNQAEIDSLSEDEQSLLGQQLKLVTLSACLGLKISIYDIDKISRLSRLVLSYVKSGVVEKPKNKLFRVTPKLIEIVKNFR